MNYQAGSGTGYDAAGNVLGYTLTNHDGSSYTNTYVNTLSRFEGYKQTSQVGSSTVLQGGSTTQSYDVNGNLIAVTDSAQGANSRVFVNDAAGHALYVNQGGHIQRELIVNGEMLGRYGDLVDGKNPTTAAGLPNYVNSADFNFSYQPISGNYPSASAGVYAVGAGDTLSSIAKGAYGDSRRRRCGQSGGQANGITNIAIQRYVMPYIA